jgi:hypothetical protein
MMKMVPHIKVSILVATNICSSQRAKHGVKCVDKGGNVLLLEDEHGS